jgi:hypothetical protein
MNFYIPNMWTYVFFQYNIVCYSFSSDHKHSLNVTVVDFIGDIFIPNCFVVLCKVHIALCKISSKSDKHTWSSANNTVLKIIL